jgi:outer membrane protein TolC
MKSKIIVFILITLTSTLGAGAETIESLQGEISWQKVEDKNYEKILSKEKILVMELQDALTMALDKNLDITVKEIEVKQARDKLLGQTAEFLPSATFSQTMSNTRGVIQLFGDQPLRISYTTFQPLINSSFYPFQGGRVFFGWLAERKSLQASKEELSTEEQNILRDTIASYYTIQKYKAQLESELIRLEEAEQNLKERIISRDEGADITLSVLLAQQEVDESKAKIESLRGSLYSESCHMNELLNLPIGNLIIPSTNADEKDLVTWIQEPHIAELLTSALKNNPDIRYLKDIVEVRRFQQAQSFAPFLPTVQIYDTQSWLGQDARNLFNNEQYGVIIRYDAMDHLGGTALAKYLEAKHMKEISRTQLKSQINKLQTQLSSDYLRVLASKKSLMAFKSALKAAEESYRQALARKKAEVGTSYDLKVAQRDFEKARSDYFDALITWKVAQVDFVRSLGMANVKNYVEGVKL